MDSREQSIVACFPELSFSVCVAQVLVGYQKKFIEKFVFPNLVCGFNNNNNNLKNQNFIQFLKLNVIIKNVSLKQYENFVLIYRYPISEGRRNTSFAI